MTTLLQWAVGRLQRRTPSSNFENAKKMADFDPDFYGQYYIDLSHLKSTKALRKHYLLHGAREGRAKNAVEATKALESRFGPLPEDFNPSTYRVLNEDLALNFKQEWQFAFHYLEHGQKEGRRYKAGHHKANGDAKSRIEPLPFRPLLSLNASRDTRHAHHDSRFAQVAHIFHHEWHGIRSATGCLPGQKVGIPADSELDGDLLRRLLAFVYECDIKKVIYQGFSKNADKIARIIDRDFNRSIEQYAVTHVTSTQFEFFFEIEMQKLIKAAIDDKVLSKVGSVKPLFSAISNKYWPKTIYNFTPNLDMTSYSEEAVLDCAFVPLENTLRKNLYTNIIAALRSKRVSQVYTVNNPTGLELLMDLRRCRVIGFQRGMQLFERMAGSTIVLNCTLAECQPMMQLEALAVGTPCLTGPLGLHELDDQPLSRLLEVIAVDNPAAITRRIDEVMEIVQEDGSMMRQMIADYVIVRNSLALERLTEFVGL